MLKSMTGYARAGKVIAGRRVILEIASVNKRALEMNVSLPRNYLYYDLLLREWIRSAITRGQVTVRLYFESDEKEGKEGIPPLTSLKGLKKSWEETAKKLGYDPKEEVTLGFLLQHLPSGMQEDLEEKDLKELVDKALRSLFKMKEKEGASLEKDIRSRLEQIRLRLKEVEKQAPNVVKHYEERLREKLKSFQGADFNEKMAREIVLFADRVDVTEEIVRLHSHLAQFDAFLKSQEPSIGRTLEFLTQEVHRELNTMAAKVSDSQCVHNVVEMKGALDKIREQILNIE